MEKERFRHLLNEVEQGREDVFVNHPDSGEGGVVIRCDGEQLVVKTGEGENRQWDYRECEEVLSRRDIFPYR
ncbi:MAG: hypothetical protein WDA20_01000 [Desulfuromonadales bacterium]